MFGYGERGAGAGSVQELLALGHCAKPGKKEPAICDGLRWSRELAQTTRAPVRSGSQLKSGLQMDRPFEGYGAQSGL
jgi:hypothetical protein